MKTYEEIHIVRTKLIYPAQFKLILMVAMGSFAVGLIPLMASQILNSSVVPSEATLWQSSSQD